jgi:signal transduction histidine kinase
LIKEKFNNYTIIIFIPIKKEYPFENKYISNFYYGQLNLNYDYSFSILPEPTSYYILDNDGSLLFSAKPTKINYSNYLLIVGFLSWIILLILLHICLLKITENYYFKTFFISIIIVIVLRLIMQLFKIPAFIYETKWFSAEIYTSNFIFSSLADTFLNSWIMLLINEFYIIRFKKHILQKKILQLTTFLLLIFNTFLCFYVWKSLIFESNISFEIFNLYEGGISILIALLTIGIYLWIIARFSLFTIHIIKNYRAKILISLLVIATILSLFFNFFGINFSFILLLLYFVLIWTRKSKHFSWFALDILIFSAFIIINTYKLYDKKRENLQQIVAYSLSNEKDYVAQMLLIDIDKRISQDKILQGLLYKANDNRYEIYKYLKDNYFYGFWNKYDLQVTICSNFDNLRLLPAGQIIRCYDYFNKLIHNKATCLENTNFYDVTSEYSEISFLGKFTYPYFLINDSITKSVFIELTRKPLINTPGYPDLLIDSKTFKDINKQWPYYAKYKSHKLIQQKGDDIQYPSEFNFKKPKTGQFLIETTDKFKHLIYSPNKKNIIVVSSKRFLWYHYLWSILFLFNFFITIFAIFYGIFYFIKNKHDFTFGFRFKYISSFIIILISSYLLIAIYTSIFFKNRYQQKSIEQLSAKNQNIINHLNEHIGNWEKIFQIPKNDLTKILITASNIFFCDINIFKPNGELYVTSRPVFFEKGFKSPIIDYNALSNIINNKTPQLIQEENIDDFVYISSYTALFDSNNNIIGILQFPYFTEREKINKEILSVQLNLINIYLLFIYLSFSIVLLIANGILKPISYLQNYFRKVQPGKQIKPIVYKEHDEILPLVNEYNRMLEELARQTEKLLISERESAWREVAKQIAHEIKNPLTPMKLNIQYLIKEKKEKGFVSDEMLNNTMNILLDQIESLSSIATAFSTFTKMPPPKLEKIELIPEIKNIIHLFTTDDLTIPLNTNKIDKVYLIADKEYLKRILNNIITNSIQAIPADRKKEISIDIKQKDKNILIAVSDNGIGISEEIAKNIFKPSFTTKSSGMGIGLALVKNMVEIMNGIVYFESKVNHGTTFYIELPFTEIEYL